MVNKENLKKELRDKTCSNCYHFHNKFFEETWCFLSYYKPYKNTCRFYKYLFDDDSTLSKGAPHYKPVQIIDIDGYGQ